MNSLNQKNLTSKLPKEIQWLNQRPRTDDTRTAKPIELSNRNNIKTRTTRNKDGNPTAREIFANATYPNREWYKHNPNPKKIDIKAARRAIENQRRLFEQMDAEVYIQPPPSKSHLANTPQRERCQAKRQKAQAEQQASSYRIDPSSNKQQPASSPTAPRRRSRQRRDPNSRRERARALKVKEANQKLTNEPIVPRTSPRVVRFQLPPGTAMNQKLAKETAVLRTSRQSPPGTVVNGEKPRRSGGVDPLMRPSGTIVSGEKPQQSGGVDALTSPPSTVANGEKRLRSGDVDAEDNTDIFRDLGPLLVFFAGVGQVFS